MAQILPIRFQEHIQVVIFMKMFENSKINEAGVNIIPTGNAPLTFRDFLMEIMMMIQIIIVYFHSLQ